LEAHLRRRVEELVEPAGVRLDGERPWDPQVCDGRLFGRLLAGGSLALGESYEDGWWECAAVDELVHRLLRAGIDARFGSRGAASLGLATRLANLQRRSRAFRIGERHYDLGDDLFRAMLDARMIYSCAFWRDARCLDEAQEAKLELLARKLALKPGLRVLDIGCGWGGTARFLAERHQVEVVGVTVSRHQARTARETCAGLPVEIRLQDYRDVRGRFDRVLSVGMFEHVGPRNYAAFMRTVAECLAEDGLFLLHTIGSNSSNRHTDPWIHRYVFPDAVLPSARQICEAIEGRFVLEDWHSFGADYDRTLLAWHRNFEEHWPQLESRYGECFHRRWRFYLLICAGGFRARRNQLWQLVLSRRGIPGGYVSVR
jgi:cyclopropane-fatty-acyl-phospholipid synthase